uniref:Uncharacterized protein n=1 Tax=Aplanochytrium stocchinoi TaxID=215587 RepID=A0A7S3PI00_9STRA
MPQMEAKGIEEYKLHSEPLADLDLQLKRKSRWLEQQNQSLKERLARMEKQLGCAKFELDEEKERAAAAAQHLYTEMELALGSHKELKRDLEKVMKQLDEKQSMYDKNCQVVLKQLDIIENLRAILVNENLQDHPQVQRNYKPDLKELKGSIMNQVRRLEKEKQDVTIQHELLQEELSKKKAQCADLEKKKIEMQEQIDEAQQNDVIMARKLLELGNQDRIKSKKLEEQEQTILELRRQVLYLSEDNAKKLKENRTIGHRISETSTKQTLNQPVQPQPRTQSQNETFSGLLVSFLDDQMEQDKAIGNKKTLNRNSESSTGKFRSC